MARTVPEWVGKTDDAVPTRAVRLRIFHRANGHCQECGIKIGLKGWEADHIKRLKDGGENRESNFQVLCIPCHKEKTGQENTLQAKANKVQYKTHSIKKTNRRGPKRSFKPEGYHYDWARRRYVKDDETGR